MKKKERIRERKIKGRKGKVEKVDGVEIEYFSFVKSLNLQRAQTHRRMRAKALRFSQGEQQFFFSFLYCIILVVLYYFQYFF